MSKKKTKCTVPFPQQWSRECTTRLRYTYIAYLVCNDYNFRRQAGWL